ncbi:hypothetical protein EYZ11_006322 [Aspergillus tanneri]|uniref:Uncharacterized protein n=1 Tax=Aspergillus tanneri TaxID=1220188 RepID=A0A4S3JLK6_9EURO|nr:hypothetical protein EYZ11_006322 [Aspergillus tanneri]
MESQSPAKEPSLQRSETMHAIETRYIQLLLELDYIPWFYNVPAYTTNWLLLAGYLVIPGTFTSLQESVALEEGLKKQRPLVMQQVLGQLSRLD